MYEPGRNTVMLNESGSCLVIGIPTVAGSGIVLHPKRGSLFVDIEDVCKPEVIRGFLHEFERMTKAGKITWHPKGSKPVAQPKSPPMRMPTAEGETVPAPPNEYDAKLNEVIEKEKRHDERTKASSTKRDLTRNVASGPGPQATAAPGQSEISREAPAVVTAGYPTETRYADPAKGEIDAGAGTGGMAPRRGADPAKGEVDAGKIAQTASPKAPGEAELRRETPPAITEPVNPYAEMDAGELFDTAVDKGVIEKMGTYFGMGGKTIANGKKNTCATIEQDAELREKIRNALNALGG